MQHLLIVEDDNIDQLAFERFAKTNDFPYTFQIVNSIRAAKFALQENKFDAIVSDFFLGDGTNFELLDLHLDIPLIVVTGTGSEEIAVDALKKGAYDYLIKDVDGYYLRMLPITIKNALHRFQVEKDNKNYQQNLEQLVKEQTRLLEQELEIRKTHELGLLKFSTAIEQSPASIVITDLDGNLNYVNPNFTKITGYSLEEVKGKNPRILKSGIHKKEVYKKLWDTIISGQNFTSEFCNKKKNGELYWEIASFSPIKNEKNEIVNFIKVAEDITVRKKLELKINNTLEDLQTAQKIAKVGSFNLNFNNNIGICSQAFFTITELPYTEQLDFKVWRELIHPDDLDGNNQYLNKLLKTGGHYNRIFRIITKKTKTVKWVHGLGEIINNNPEKHSIFKGLIQDITQQKNEEGIIKKRNALLNAILESTDDGILVVDNNNIIKHRNSAFNKLWKIPKELWQVTDDTVILNSVSSLLANPDEFYKKVAELYNSNKPSKDDIFFKDGSIFERNSEPFIVNGKNMGRVWDFRNVTEERNAQILKDVLFNISNDKNKELNLVDLLKLIQKELEKLIDTSNFFVALYSEQNDTFTAPYMQDMYDNFTSWKAGKSLSAYVLKSKKSLLATKNDLETLKNKEKIKLTGKGSEVWLGVPLMINKKAIGVMVVQNYTNKNAYTKKDQELLEFVSDRISESIYRKITEEELQKAFEKATESDRLKTAFLQNMSHEIRTPMNGILGFTSLLENPDLSAEKQQQYIQVISKSSKRLLTTLNDIMDISKIDSGQVSLTYTKTEINKELNSLFNFYKPEAETKNLHFSIKKGLSDELAIIETDTSKFYAILSNLIKNAIKYTEKGSIEFGYQLKDNSLEFYVKDTGIGVAKNRQEAIFERFVQADIEDTKVMEGTGLGLTISRLYAEMLGGKIWLTSKQNKGSVFYFSLPFAKNIQPINWEVKDAEIIQSEQPTVANKKLKILVAEDEEYAFEFLAIILEEISDEIVHAKNGIEAVTAAKENKFDLILMDIKMPHMNGLEATKAIRKFNKDVIIIAQTAFAFPEDREKALEIGCNEYISKPIVLEKLKELLAQFY